MNREAPTTELLELIKSQLQFAPPEPGGNHDQGRHQEPDRDGFVRIETISTDYFQALRSLRDQLLDQDDAGGGGNGVLISDAALIRPLMAFILNDENRKWTGYLDTDIMIQRHRRIQSNRSGRPSSPTGRSQTYTDDLWDDVHRQGFLSGAASQYLVVRGTHHQNVRRRLSCFGLEMVTYLRQNSPVLVLLQSSLSAGRVQFSTMRGLRELVIQALRYVQTPWTASELAGLAQDFRKAASALTWSVILRGLLLHMPLVAIVIDTAALDSDEVGAELYGVFENIQEIKPSNFMRMLLITHKTTSERIPSSCLLKVKEVQTDHSPRHHGRRARARQLRSSMPDIPYQNSLCDEDMVCLPTDVEINNDGDAELEPCSTAEGETDRSADIGTPGVKDNENTSDGEPSGCNFPTQSGVQDSEELQATTTNPAFCNFLSLPDKSTNSPPEDELATKAQLLTHEMQNLQITPSRSHHPASTNNDDVIANTKIAIMCALIIECNAIQTLFDHIYSDSELGDNGNYYKTPGDMIGYIVGRIGCQNVVLVPMGGMGKTNAAKAAGLCHAAFPKLELILVAGICGGVPFVKSDGEQKEIVLGDVIISEGLIPFDYGRQYEDGFHQRHCPSDNPGKLPQRMRMFLAGLKVGLWKKQLTRSTRGYLEHVRRGMCQDDDDDDDDDGNGGILEYPGAENDWLFDSSYHHMHRRDPLPHGCVCTGDDDEGSERGSRKMLQVCEDARTDSCEKNGCDMAKLVRRKRLEKIMAKGGGTGPAVHFGLVASGDQVMKSETRRDALAKQGGVIAFEMEGAGVWGEVDVPCLIIKSVCDYADGHKNKKWQSYATATAAACVKAFLERWKPYG